MRRDELVLVGYVVGMNSVLIWKFLFLSPCSGGDILDPLIKIEDAKSHLIYFFKVSINVLEVLGL